MKKLISVFLALLVSVPFFIPAFAAEEEKVLKFKPDGTFKILQINDTQDIDRCNKRLIEFINAALDTEKPDLVVFVGDQLSDNFPNANKKRAAAALNNILDPLKERNIPFLMTLGNHDHDRENAISKEEQFEVYMSYENCYAPLSGGADEFTYNVPVMTSDGQNTAFSIYMMDTHNKLKNGSYEGIRAEQLDWYNAKSAQLRAQNNGRPLPSLLFQHIPVKEIYSLLQKDKFSNSSAVFAKRDNNWYIVNKTLAAGDMGEAPCSENFDVATGQYQAWVKNGDIMGAFFAHDHVNNFVGVTEDGIKMGYNGGSGFRAYGSAKGRTVRVIELKENDVENYTTKSLTYTDLTGKKAGFLIGDLMTPAILTPIMRIVYFCFGWLINMFK